MNKRANAIWKLVVFLGLFILALGIKSTLTNNKSLSSSIGDRAKCASGSKDCSGIINSFYEFGKYPGSLTKEDKKMLEIIKSYGTDSDEILRQSEKTGLNNKTKMAELGFMEIYSAGSKSKRESSIYGFSLDNLKIKGGEYFLTEIKGTPGKKCKNKLRLKNVTFKNDEIEIGSDLSFNHSDQEIECKDGRQINDTNFLYLTDDGEVWYNSTSNIHNFEFKVTDSKILNIYMGDIIADNFIILKNTDQSIIGLSKTNFTIPNGCGMLLKLDLDKEVSSLSDITISSSKRFYDLNILDKYDLYNDSLLTHVNYFHSKLDSDNNVEVYIKTDNEVDEYSFEISCFECDIKDNVKKRSELEISRAKLKERIFYFSMNTNDPSDLTNVVMFSGQDGYNQGKRLRAVVPTNVTLDQSGIENPIGLVEYQNYTHTVTIGDTIGDFKMVNMNQKYFLALNTKSNTIDTLKYKNGK